MARADKGGDARARPRREVGAKHEAGGADRGHACATGRGHRPHPLMQLGRKPASAGGAARVLWWAWSAAHGVKADAACSAAWDLRAQVVPQLAAELAKPVETVADTMEEEQARHRLQQAEIRARSNATLKLTDQATQAHARWNLGEPDRWDPGLQFRERTA